MSCLSHVFLCDSNMVREHTLNESSSFKFIGVCFVGQDMVCAGNGPGVPVGWGVRLLLLWDGVSVCICPFDLTSCLCCWRLCIFPEFLSSCLVSSSECSVEVPGCSSGFVCFSFRICQTFFRILQGTVRCEHSLNYVFLLE